VALYILEPGEPTFHRYTDADGLHIANAGTPGIMAVAGGHAGAGFVGYNDVDITDTQNDPNMLDAVVLSADGSLDVTHVVEHNDDDVVGSASDGGITDSDFSYYEDRGVRRLLFDHTYHPGALYVGWNHGVSLMNWDHPDPVTGLPFADHVHPEVYTSDGTSMQAEFRALALDPTHRVDSMGGAHAPGVVWVGGEFTGGAVDWKSSLYAFTDNNLNPLVEAFDSPPVFPVASPGDPVNLRAVAVRSNGDVWFASGPEWDPQTDAMLGLALWSGNQLSYVEPSSIGLPTREIWDMVCMPDDRLAFATDQGLFIWDPDSRALEQVEGLPSSTILQLYLDTTVSPPPLYVVMDSGFAVVH
jgi:hypothetical protein